MPPAALTVRTVLTRTEEYLRRAGIETPRLDAEVLLAHVLTAPRIQLYTGFDRPLVPAEIDAYRALVRRRADRVPVAYLTGKKEFHSLAFRVTPDVLVPRPETEHLVDAAVTIAREEGAARILDVGTGSGCVAVSLAVDLPAARIVATDVSQAALAVARENAETHGVADRIEFLAGDLFEPVRGSEPFGLVVSNPPYVGEDEETDPECRAEPAGAVFSPGDALAFYRRLMAGAGAVLAPGGSLLMELPGDRLDEIRAAMTAGFAETGVVLDYQGLPRVLVVRRDNQGGNDRGG